MDRVVSVGCKHGCELSCYAAAAPPEYPKKLPPLHARPCLTQVIVSVQVCVRPEQLANARRCRSWVIRVVLGLYPTERHRSAVPQIPVITRPEIDRRSVPTAGVSRCSKRHPFESTQSIISWARTIRDTGTSIPRALAVVRLMMSSNRLGNSIGRSAGLAPLRTCPV